jgi:hypothetical protein
MIHSLPDIQTFYEIGDTTTIPKGAVGSVDREPGVWAKLLSQTPRKIAVRGEWLNGGLLPKLIEMTPIRELMARPRFFYYGKREEERVSH